MKMIFYILLLVSLSSKALSAEYEKLWSHKIQEVYKNIIFSYDGKWGWANNTVLQYENDKLTEIAQLDLPGKIFVFMDTLNTIDFVDISTKKIFRYSCETKTIDTVDISFLPNISGILYYNKKFIVPSNGNVYNIQKGEEILKLSSLNIEVKNLMITDDDKYLIVRTNFDLHKIDLEAKEVLFFVPTYTGYQNFNSIKDIGNNLVFYNSKEIYVFSIDNFNLVNKISLENKNFVVNNDIRTKLPLIHYFPDSYPYVFLYDTGFLVNYLTSEVSDLKTGEGFVYSSAIINEEDTLFFGAFKEGIPEIENYYLVRYSYAKNQIDTLAKIFVKDTMFHYDSFTTRKFIISETKNLLFDDRNILDIAKKKINYSFPDSNYYYIGKYDEENLYFIDKNNDKFAVIYDFANHTPIDSFYISVSGSEGINFSFDNKYYIANGDLYTVGLEQPIKKGIYARNFLNGSENYYYCHKDNWDSFEIYDIENEDFIISNGYIRNPKTLSYNKQSNELVYYTSKSYYPSKLYFLNLDTKEEYEREMDFSPASLAVSQDGKYIMATHRNYYDSLTKIVFYDYYTFDFIMEIDLSDFKSKYFDYSNNFKYLLLRNTKNLICLKLNLEVNSIDDILTQYQPISVFPNPTSQNITVAAEMPISKIEIYSISGDKEKEYNNINLSSLPLEIESLQAGCYIIKIYFENYAISKRFIKE